MPIIYGTGFEMGSQPMPDSDLSGVSVVTMQTSDGGMNPHNGNYMIRLSGGWWRVVSVNDTEVYAAIWLNPRDFWSFFGGNSGDGCRIQAELADGTLVELKWDETDKTFDFYVDGTKEEDGTNLGLADDEAWFLLEVYFSIANAGGACQAFMDGDEIINFSGDTQPGATDQIAYFRIFSSMSFRNAHIDDITIRDDQFPGDVRYDALVPNGDDTAQWTPSTGVDNYALVDEVPASDSDYNESSSDGDQDLYDMSDWDDTEKTPVAVVHWVRAFKDSAEDQKVIHLLQSGVTLESSAAKAILTSARYSHEIHMQDPNAGPGAWTDAAIDALLTGVESEIPP